MTLFSFLSFISGILIFVYAIFNGSHLLENLVSFKLRNYLTTASNNSLRAVLGGLIFSLITQSSSATSVIIITFVSSSLIALPAALAMILGAGVGATLTVQLIAFNIYDWAIVICGAGIAIRMLSSTSRGKNLGEGIFYFGLIFLGMKIMSDSLTPLKNSPLFGRILGNLLSTPSATLILSILFTALIQTSTATLGIIISLAASGMIDLHSALILTLGANIGTCSTAVISSFGGNIASKHFTYGFLLIKIIGVAVIYPFTSIITGWSDLLAASPARQIAHFHTLFNFLLLAFLPATGYIALLLKKMLPARLLTPTAFHAIHLDTKALISPNLALAYAHREVIRMADIVETMLRESLKALEADDPDPIMKVEKLEGDVDILNREIKLYLTKLSLSSVSSEQLQREMELLTFTVNLEHIADIMEGSLMNKARKRQLMGVKFSPQGWKDIVSFHQLVLANFNMALGAFVEQNYALARQVLAQKQKVKELEWELRQAHINRLHKGLSETVDSTSFHMDILRDLQMINSFISKIIYPIIEDHLSHH